MHINNPKLILSIKETPRQCAVVSMSLFSLCSLHPSLGFYKHFLFNWLHVALRHSVCLVSTVICLKELEVEWSTQISSALILTHCNECFYKGSLKGAASS